MSCCACGAIISKNYFSPIACFRTVLDVAPNAKDFKALAGADAEYIKRLYQDYLKVAPTSLGGSVMKGSKPDMKAMKMRCYEICDMVIANQVEHYLTKGSPCILVVTENNTHRQELTEMLQERFGEAQVVEMKKPMSLTPQSPGPERVVVTISQPV